MCQILLSHNPVKLVFELAWTLLADRRYEEAAEAFLKIKELNSWCAIQMYAWF